MHCVNVQKTNILFYFILLDTRCVAACCAVLKCRMQNVPFSLALEWTETLENKRFLFVNCIGNASGTAQQNVVDIVLMGSQFATNLYTAPRVAKFQYLLCSEGIIIVIVTIVLRGFCYSRIKFKPASWKFCWHKRVLGDACFWWEEYTTFNAAEQGCQTQFPCRPHQHYGYLQRAGYICKTI